LSVQDNPPNIDKTRISSDGTKVTVVGAVLKSDFTTSMGRVAKGLILNVKVAGDPDNVYAQIFSLDKAEIGGSAGRVLTKIKVKNISELSETKLKEFVGKSFIVQNRNSKLYWQ